MKAEGLLWLPPLPKDWTLVRGRVVATLVQRPPSAGDGIVTAFRDGQVTLRSKRRVDGFTEAVHEIGYHGVRAGELVIHSMDGFAGAIGVSDSDGKMSPVVHIYAVPDDNPHYVAHVLRIAARSGFIQSLSKGIRERSTAFDKSTFKYMVLPRPPRSEQDAILTYLDRETARIDTLIEEQQRLIELLHERRGTVISSAVARGLDQSVSLKDSGLPGAGHVPVHWDRTPLRYTISFQEGPGILAKDFRDEGIPLLRVSCVRTAESTLEGCNYLDPEEVDRRWSHFRVDLGDLLISASASMGTVSEVTEETVGSVPYTGIIRIKPGSMNKDFIRWFVVSAEFIDQVDSLKTGATIQHFGPTHLAQMHVVLPPASEQRQIAAYLDIQTAKIDMLITESERFIELARERRSALITAAVTGQINVREMA